MEAKCWQAAAAAVADIIHPSLISSISIFISILVLTEHTSCMHMDGSAVAEAVAGVLPAQQVHVWRRGCMAQAWATPRLVAGDTGDQTEWLACNQVA